MPAHLRDVVKPLENLVSPVDARLHMLAQVPVELQIGRIEPKLARVEVNLLCKVAGPIHCLNLDAHFLPKGVNCDVAVVVSVHGFFD